MWTIQEILEGCKGTPAGEPSVDRPAGQVGGFSIDSRTIRPGELFVALHGPRFDGHDFVDAALQRGAAGAVVARREFQARRGRWASLSDRALFVLVDDPLAALQSMASWHRERFRPPLIGVTGSNGKSTTKEMIASILAGRGPVLKNEGNLNNHIGLPLSLLRLGKEHHAAVVEIGISQKGEMKRLCEMARPTVGVVTNVGPAHLEFLGDLAGVAEEKGKMFESVRNGGIAVINRDDPYLQPWEERLGDKWTFGLNAPADVTAGDLSQESGRIRFMLRIDRRGGERAEITLSTFGVHQVYNALAAAAASAALGFGLNEIREGLAQFRPMALRSELLEAKGVHILLDAYNANPASMKASLEMLASYRPAGGGGEGRKIALLGDMLELGAAAAPAHFEIGRRAAEVGIDLLIVTGDWAEKTAEGARRGGMTAEAVSIHPDLESVRGFLREKIKTGDCILIKGSRGMKMERALAGLGIEGRL